MNRGRSQVLSTIPVWPQPLAKVRARLGSGGNRGPDCVQKKDWDLSSPTQQSPRLHEQIGALLACTRSSACPSASVLPARPREGQRQEAILGPVIGLLPEPS